MKVKFSRNCNAVKCLKSVVSFLESNASDAVDIFHPGLSMEFNLFSWDPFCGVGHTVSKEFPLNDYVLECSDPIPEFMTVDNIEMAIAGCKKAMLSHINSSLQERDSIRDEIAYVNNRLKNAVDKKMHSVKHWKDKLSTLEEKESEIVAEIAKQRFYQQCINENPISYTIGFKKGGIDEKRDYIEVLPLLDIKRTVFPVYYSDSYGFCSIEPYRWYRYAVDRIKE